MLILFTKEHAPNLVEEDYEVSAREKSMVKSFLMGKEDFRECGLEIGQEMKLTKEVKALKDNTKRPFSSYRSLKSSEV